MLGVVVVVSVVATASEAGLLILIVLLATSISPSEAAALTIQFREWSLSLPGALLAGAIFAVIRTTSHFMLAQLSASLTGAYEKSMKTDLYRAFSQATWEVQAAQSAGEFQNLLTTDVEAARALLESLARGALGAIGLTVLLLVAVVSSPVSALALVGFGIGLAAFLHPLGRAAAGHTRNRAEQMSVWAADFSQAVTASREIRVFGVSEAFDERLGKSLDSAMCARFLVDRLSQFMPALYQSIVLSLAFGGLITAARFSPDALADAAPVALLLLRALSYSQIVQSTYHAVIERTPFLDRIEKRRSLLTQEETRFGDASIGKFESLEFMAVSFSYVDSGRQALSEASLHISSGELVGVVGASGSGKSTLCLLALRILRPTEGAVLLNGIDLNDVASECWAKIVGYVPQDPLLIRGSILDNIRFGRSSLTMDEIDDAAARSDIKAFVDSLPEGMHTELGERGSGLSGGQKQRICIARALAGCPQFMIFDEATSGLDSKSQDMVASTIVKLRGSVTSVVITHRSSLAQLCDRVVSVSDGRLVGHPG
jgi:ABC-type multidrug transport system fused ATPase/permease subunit